MLITPKLFIGIFTIFFACNPNQEEKKPEKQFSLEDFYSANPAVESKVNAVFSSLDEVERIGQMIVPAAGTTGKPTTAVDNLIKKRAIGGVLMLGGEKEYLRRLGQHFDSLAKIHNVLPLIFSADAEPSLINRKIKGTTSVPKTIELNSKATCDSVSRIIARELTSLNIRHNFAPVLDMSPDNEAITNRSFGSDPKAVIALAGTFIRASQENQIAATIKHFPGHGLVSGDTHQQLVTIDGHMQEVSNYKPLIEMGVISVMVGHIAVINNERFNTDGLPASCSKRIVTDLLKKEMGFRGIVVTDAMNMGALKQIENASLKAMEAGCDMILMEPDELKLLELAIDKYHNDVEFRKQIDESVRKILRLKVCLNLI